MAYEPRVPPFICPWNLAIAKADFTKTRPYSSLLSQFGCQINRHSQTFPSALLFEAGMFCDCIYGNFTYLFANLSHSLFHIPVDPSFPYQHLQYLFCKPVTTGCNSHNSSALPAWSSILGVTMLCTSFLYLTLNGLHTKGNIYCTKIISSILHPVRVIGSFPGDDFLTSTSTYRSLTNFS